MSEREELVLTDEVRVIQFVLSAGEQLTWHYHTHIQESIFCLAGVIRVLSEQRTQTIRTGQKVSFAAGQPHALQNAASQPATYLLIQHGHYDFIECEPPARHHSA